MRNWPILPLIGLILLAAWPAPGGAAADTVVLYDAALGPGGPADQGLLLYLTEPAPPLGAAQGYSDGAATLDTSPDLADKAGYFARRELLPSLRQDPGISLVLRAELLAEQHDSPDRAGFSLILICDDLRGIELGFWQDRVWAQADGELIFTQAEGADLAPGPLDLRLEVGAAGYRLLRDGQELLSGPLRDYSAFGLPYSRPRLVFLGDNTTSAGASLRISYVALELAAEPPPPRPTPHRVHLPLAASDL